MDAFKSSNFSVEEYEASCRKKFEVDNAIYKKIFTFLESRSFVNDEEKPERKFIWRKLNDELCKAFGIKRSVISVYHPQTNGLAERMNWTFKTKLTKLANASWSD